MHNTSLVGTLAQYKQVLFEQLSHIKLPESSLFNGSAVSRHFEQQMDISFIS